MIARSSKMRHGTSARLLLLSDNFTDDDLTDLSDHTPDVNVSGNPWRPLSDWAPAEGRIIDNMLGENSGFLGTTMLDVGVDTTRIEARGFMPEYTAGGQILGVILLADIDEGWDCKFLRTGVNTLRSTIISDQRTHQVSSEAFEFDFSAEYDPDAGILALAVPSLGISHTLDVSSESKFGTFIGVTCLPFEVRLDNLKVFT